MSPGTCRGREAAGGAAKGKGKGQNEAGAPGKIGLCEWGCFKTNHHPVTKGDLQLKRSLTGRENNSVISFTLRQMREPDSHLNEGRMTADTVEGTLYT